MAASPTIVLWDRRDIGRKQLTFHLWLGVVFLRPAITTFGRDHLHSLSLSNIGEGPLESALSSPS
ncbi:hypothetical protein QBC46DRAFT_357682 [Diplogelasinospora grovesii]|uniref:Uncharacterized protein n=1 Tax=Diplogelasinospora grovesii TaxID=303347 RepID=A0AAN6N0Z6_9PEZI|nr:hypothetical protein QBC46DRAFT_357682 [Diplogelasinospora grovesii]